MEGTTFSRAGSSILGKSDSMINFKAKDLLNSKSTNHL